MLIWPLVRVRGADAEVHIPLRSRDSTPDVILRGRLADVTVPPPPPAPNNGVISCIIPLYSMCSLVKSPDVNPLVIESILLYTYMPFEGGGYNLGWGGGLRPPGGASCRVHRCVANP